MLYYMIFRLYISAHIDIHIYIYIFVYIYIHLAGGDWNMTLFSHSVGNVIIPTDFHIFQGVQSTNQIYIDIRIGVCDTL